MRAIDLFCGAGGLTRGLLDAGIEVVAGIDVDPSVGETYERNNRPVRFLRRDIRTVGPEDLMALLGDCPELSWGLKGRRFSSSVL